MSGKINYKKLILLLLIPIALGTAYYLMNSSRKDGTCSDVDISMNFKTEKPLLTETEIYSILQLNKGKVQLIGKPLKELKLNQYEKKLEHHNAIKKANVYIGIRGDLKIELTQREPILRVITKPSNGYYLSEDYKRIPLSNNYTPNLIPVSGHLKQKVDIMLCTLMAYVNNNSFWKAQIEQFFVSANGDISFIPFTGVHEVILGDINNLDIKFKKLELFYEKGLSKIGWNKYKTINLKYKDQVICK